MPKEAGWGFEGETGGEILPKYDKNPMNLLEITRVLSRLDEGIDIHGLYNRYKNMPGIDRESVEGAIKDYRSNLQSRKKELLSPYGLDNLDNFKESPDGFVAAVRDAMNAFTIEREAKALYSTVYEDDHCLITMPKGPKGAAAAGSLCKVDGKPRCPWCVAVKYPDNKVHWDEYGVEALFFVYAKENGVSVNAWCLALGLEDCLETLYGNLSFSNIEDLGNYGNGDDDGEQEFYLQEIQEQTGLDTDRLRVLLSAALQPKKAALEKKEGSAKFLFRAIRHGLTGVVRDYINAGNSLDCHDEKDNYSPLSMAVRWGREDICKLLLDAGVDVDVRDSWGDGTALMMAVKMNKPGLIKMFLDAGGDIMAHDSQGDTALHIAVKWNNPEAVKLLLNAGVKPNVENHKGKTPLMVAAQQDRRDIFDQLLKAGAKVDAADKSGETALFFAVDMAHEDICRKLIESGADVSHRAEGGRSPLHTAATGGFVDICKMLLDAGGDIEEKTDFGDTPLLLASKI